MKKISALGKRLLGFSLIELTITMVVIAVITAAFAPTITKKMKSSSTAVVGLSTKCEQRVNADCQLCDKSGCVWCGLSRSVPYKYVDEKSCTHKNCDSNCLRCSGPGASCLQCSPGYYLSSGQCLDCPAGKYCLGGNKAPINCPIGTYQPSAGAHASCINCPIGKYQSGVGKTSCDNCAAGKYQDAEGQSSCVNCPIGKYQSSVGKTSCDNCAAGKYQDAVGQSSCKDCPGGQYQDKIGQSSCIQCPLNYACSASAVTGACGVGQGSKLNVRTCASCPANCKDCEDNSVCQLCNPKYYLSSGSCVGCPAMKYCPGDSKTPYDCPGGTFSVAKSETCSACDHYGAQCIACNESRCTQCATNYTLNASYKCQLTECPYGKYLLGGQCVTCNAGYYCPGGISDRLECPANKWSGEGQNVCNNCPSDRPLSPKLSTSESACVSCGSKFGSDCTSCNYSKCLSCPSKYYMSSAAGNPACTSCNTKWHANCSACNSSKCTACDDGWETHSSKVCNKLCQDVIKYKCDGTTTFDTSSCTKCPYRTWNCKTGSDKWYIVGNYGCKAKRDGCRSTKSDKYTSHGNACCNSSRCFYCSSDCSTGCRIESGRGNFDWAKCTEFKAQWNCGGTYYTDCVEVTVCE